MVFTIGVVALAASPVVGLIVLGGCVAAALVGPVQAVQALMVATLVAYGNPAIIKPAPEAGVLLRLVFLAAIFRLVPTMRGSDLRLVWPVWLFSIAEAFSSIHDSPAMLISLMKVAELFCGVTAVLIAYNHVRPAQLAGLHRWLITLGLTVIGLSGLTLARPAIGLGGDGGLQGLLNQPQALGIFMAPFAAWAVTGVLLMRRRATRLELLIALLVGALIVLSKARTAGFGAGAGVMVVMMSRIPAAAAGVRPSWQADPDDGTGVRHACGVSRRDRSGIKGLQRLRLQRLPWTGAEPEPGLLRLAWRRRDRRVERLPAEAAVR